MRYGGVLKVALISKKREEDRAGKEEAEGDVVFAYPN